MRTEHQLSTDTTPHPIGQDVALNQQTHNRVSVTLVSAADTGREKTILDVKNSVEVGRTVSRTTGAGRDVHGSHTPSVTVLCDFDVGHHTTVAKLGDNFVEFCSVSLRNENHLCGDLRWRIVESTIVIQWYDECREGKRGENTRTRPATHSHVSIW